MYTYTYCCWLGAGAERGCEMEDGRDEGFRGRSYLIYSYVNVSVHVFIYTYTYCCGFGAGAERGWEREDWGEGGQK